MHEPRVRPRRLRAVLAAFALVVATLVATASPAAAAVCFLPTESPTEPIIQMSEEPGSTTTLRMFSGTLFLDGVLCGPATSITVLDLVPDASADKVLVIDATESWGDVFLNLVLEIEFEVAEEVGASYDVRVLTGDAAEVVTLTNNGADSALLVTRAGGGTQLTADVVNRGGNTGDPINWDFHLGDGDDSIQLEDVRFLESLRVDGGDGDDTIVGTSLDDVLIGGEGDDEIRGLAGDDTLNGQAGDDTVVGAAGDDTINGGGGVDTLRGNAGDDVIRGGAGDDVIRGQGGDDTLRGNAGADDIRGNGGADSIFGNGGADVLRGNGGDDMLNGGRGQDDVAGNGGDDSFNTGDRAPDQVDGGAGDDTCNPCSNSDDVRRVENR